MKEMKKKQSQAKFAGSRMKETILTITPNSA